MSSAKKATIYVDVDDEITTLIDKMTQAKEGIVALVLPKRAAMLQSIVNMKLLKRSADQAKKKIVLITSESSILPLAGAVGLHVAKTLQTKPVIPPSPMVEEDSPEETEVEDVEVDKTAPVGALAGLSTDEEDIETAEIPEEKTPAEAAAKVAKPKKAKKFKIPNFNKFRVKLILGVLALLLLIGGWVMASMVLPRAEILVKTDSKTFTKDLIATAVPDIAQVDTENSVVPAKTEELQKRDSDTVQATGERNDGKKAAGEMTVTNCISDGEEHTVPRGTLFTREGKTFESTESIKLEQALFNFRGECVSTGDSSGEVDVVAVEGGTSYNIGDGSYTSSMAGINAYGSDMKGGTDKIVKIVSQADIDNARQRLREKTSEGTVEDLQALLRGQGYIPFESTYEPGEPEIQSSVEPNTEASEVTVTSTTTYKMSGALKTALEALVVEASAEDIDGELQVVTETGIDKATIRVTEKREDGSMSLSVETIVTAGPQLNEANLKQEVLGKKRGETESILKSKAGVSDVEVNYSPFWVGATPDNEDKVRLTVENPDDAPDATNQQDAESE